MSNFVRKVRIEHENFPIFIPSKGRPECKTAEFLKKEGIPFKIIIEPQDIPEYRRWGKKNLLLLPENDKGIAYTRNFVLKHCKRKHIDWCWVMDDDLTSFFKTVANRNVKCTWKQVREHIEPQLKKSNRFGQASLEYSQYAWSSNGKPKINSYNDCFVALKTSLFRKHEITWDESFALKSDRDISIQLIMKGLNNVRFTKFSFGTPENGSNKGGLHGVYEKKSIERLMSFKLEEKWGHDIVSVEVKKGGRIDAIVNWKKFKPRKKQ